MRLLGRFLRSPCILLPLLYVVAAMLVDPRGEFPLNDDWSYTRSAFALARENRLQVDEWCAMSLVGQALYGGLLARIFGESFLALRISTLTLALATSLILWALLSRIGLPARYCWVFTLGWLFNPIYFNLSFTFMTEAPFLFFIAMAMLLFLHHLRTESMAALVAAGGFFGYAFLIRQTALLFLLAAFLAIASHRARFGVLRMVRQTSALSSIPVVMIVGYFIWLTRAGGATPATRRKFDLLYQMTPEQLLGNLFGALFYLAFLLLPALAALFPHLIRFWTEVSRRIFWLHALAWTSLAASGLIWFHWRYSNQPYLPASAYHARMPFLLNILYDTGLGPFTLDPTYYGPSPTPTYPAIWLGVTVLVALGLVVLGLLFSLGYRARKGFLEPSQSLFCLFAAWAAIFTLTFEIAFSHIEEGGLFDRHNLTVTLPLLALLGCIAATSDQRVRAFSPRLSRLAALAEPTHIAILAICAFFSIAATHDYFSWNRLRWDIGREVLAQGVDPLRVSGGFEFNAWHNYETFRARGRIERVFHWWYDRPDYVIALSPAEGTKILDSRQYFSWLHLKRLPVYLLKKE